MRYLGRWPFLLGAALCFVAAVELLRNQPEGREAASAALLVAGAVLLGAFIVLNTRGDD